MNDNKKDITKISDLASWDHEDEINFEENDSSQQTEQQNNQEDLLFESSQLETQVDEIPEDEFLNFNDQELDSAFKLEEEASNDSMTLLSELHQYDSNADSTNIEKELTTIKEINKEINSHEKIVNMHEPLTASIPRNVPIEASPSFSLILKKIKKENKNDIKNVLATLGLSELFTEQLFERALKNKELLIPRISEFVGVVLIHKLKNLNLGYELYLSSSLNNSEFDPMDNGALFEEKSTFKNMQKNIITSKENTIPNHEIHEIGDLISIESQLNPSTDHGVEQEYKFLVESLKLKAIKNDADAIIGLNFHHFKIKTTGMIKVVISGNLAWIK